LIRERLWGHLFTSILLRETMTGTAVMAAVAAAVDSGVDV